MCYRPVLFSITALFQGFTGKTFSKFGLTVFKNWKSKLLVILHWKRLLAINWRFKTGSRKVCLRIKCLLKTGFWSLKGKVTR